MEEHHGTRINLARVREALQGRPDTIGVACPYCLTMFEDGLKDEGADDRVQVKDIAEVVAAAMRPVGKPTGPLDGTEADPLPDGVAGQEVPAARKPSSLTSVPLPPGRGGLPSDHARGTVSGQIRPA